MIELFNFLFEKKKNRNLDYDFLKKNRADLSNDQGRKKRKKIENCEVIGN